jgi:hypothetical protein
MALQPDPWAIQGQSHEAPIARSAIAALLGSPAAAFTAGVQVTTAGGGHGIVGATDLAVTQNGTPNMSVNVAAGRAFIRGGASAGAIAVGVYSVMNDATTNVAIAAADPTNPRIDLVCVQVRDTNYGEAADEARFFVVAGTPAAVPAVPSVASLNVLVLAQVAVAAATTTIVTGNITDKRTRASALNAPIICTSTTRPTGASLFEGLLIIETDTDRIYIYSGSAWIFVANYGTLGRTGVILTDAAQSIANVTASDITWGTEVSDIDGWTSGASATLTVPTGWDGRYILTYSGSFASSPGTQSSVVIFINGSSEAEGVSANGAFFRPSVSIARTLAATDTIKVQAYQNSGAAINLTSRLEVVWLGR